MVVVIPWWFLSTLQSGDKDVGGVDTDNRKIFTDHIHENITGKQIPGILAYSQEFSAMSCRTEDEVRALKDVRATDAVKEAIPKEKKNTNDAEKVKTKSICLLVGYMHNLLDEKIMNNEGLQKDLETVLRAIPSYMDIMLSQTMMLAQLYKMGRSPKKITAKNIMTLVQFSQNLMQGGWNNKDPYGILPYFGPEECKRCKDKMGNKTLFQYCRLSREDRKQFAAYIFGQNGHE